MTDQRFQTELRRFIEASYPDVWHFLGTQPGVLEKHICVERGELCETGIVSTTIERFCETWRLGELHIKYGGERDQWLGLVHEGGAFLVRCDRTGVLTR